MREPEMVDQSQVKNNSTCVYGDSVEAAHFSDTRSG